MDITLRMTTRRRILSTGLLALASAFLPGAALVQNVHAGKKKVKATGTVADRTQSQRESCETIGGGNLAVLDGPNGSNTTECKGGDFDGYTCYNTKKDTACRRNLTKQPSSPLTDAGGPPSDGVNEQPSDGKPVGGGADVNPGPAEEPDGGGAGPIILYSRRQVNAESRRYGKRRGHKKGRGASRKR